MRRATRWVKFKFASPPYFSMGPFSYKGRPSGLTGEIELTENSLALAHTGKRWSENGVFVTPSRPGKPPRNSTEQVETGSILAGGPILQGKWSARYLLGRAGLRGDATMRGSIPESPTWALAADVGSWNLSSRTLKVEVERID